VEHADVTSPARGPSARLAAVRIEPYDRRLHGDGPARVIEAVYREYGWTWEPEGYHRDVMRPEVAYAAPAGFFDVAVDAARADANPAARVIGTVAGLVREGGIAELERLYLLAEERGRGVGRALFERLLAWARDARCRRAILWSDKRLHAAHRLYERAGFSRVGERICNDPEHSPEWGYAKDLA
jgi:GNAT superfamily N-acetyltransferase